ncbi:Dynein heavy chain, cytoplasmic-like Protein, partial [Gryllus bimaculatus]
ELKSALEVPTDNLQGFRSVLQTIANIHSDSLETEFRFQLIRDSFHTLEIHNIPFPEEELKLANDLPIQWEDLYKAAITRSNRLESTKPKFSALAQTEIDDFVIVCNEFAERFQKEGPPSVVEDLDQGLALMEEFTPVFQEINKRRFDLVNAEMLFDLPVTDYGDFLLVCKEMEGLEEIYKLYRTLKTVRKTWGKTLWVNLNPHLLIKEIDQFLHQFQLLPEDIQKLSTGIALEKNIQQLKFSIPLLVELKNECLRKRHWSELMQKSGHEFNMTVDEFTLENMFALKLHLCADVVTEIINRATKELAIEIGVGEIDDRWNNADLKICLHIIEEDEKGFILGSMEELMQLLENDSMKLQIMAESQYVGPFLNTVQLLEKSLFVITEVLDEWLCVQKKWLCLEKVFRNDEVCRQLPEVTKEFYSIEQTFIKMMKQTSIRKNLMYCCHLPHRLSELKLINDGLNQCQKSLNNFLDLKRSTFPHFYFISNNDLVSILGSNDPTFVRKFVIKMFDSITDLRFHFHDNETVRVVSAIVSYQEEMFLQKECPLENRIEKWMSVVVQESQKTIRFLIKKAIYEYGKLRQPRIEWILGFQGTICLAASQVWWTAEVENAFNLMNQGKNSAMMEYLEVLNRQMNELVIYLKSQLNETDRTKLNMVFITDIHARDIIEIFIRDSVTYPKEFHWESQLRYYWMRDEDHLYVKQCTGTFQYGYEYIRLNRKIVITPLTNRVYLTFTQALSLHLGGAATGPTGTGKTETIKELAKALGMLCKVFNCSNCMENRTMTRILSGLVQCGAWGCFAGFNYISVSELSVISTQLQSIRNALMFKADQFM